MSRCTPKYWFRRAHGENFRSVHFCLFRQHRPGADIYGHGRSQGGSGRHAVRSSSIKERTFGEKWRLDGYTARTAGPSAENSLRIGTRRAERRSSLIKKVASLAMPYPARVASRKASAFVALKRPLTATVRMCPSMLKRQSTGRPPCTKARPL